MYAAQAVRGVAAGGRGVGDVLEQIKLEFNQLAEESNSCQRQRDEYQHKCKLFFVFAVSLCVCAVRRCCASVLCVCLGTYTRRVAGG